MEKHDHMTQFIRIEAGEGLAKVEEDVYELKDGAGVIIPPGVYHDIFNTSWTVPLQLYTIYNRVEHPPAEIELAQ
jgi:mannose-6-phosphate isomerase-like protein (cupin superfamily)